MRFLADENIFPSVISYLRKLGHDVKDVFEADARHSTDDEVLDVAFKENRTIITFDKHFGDILRYPPRSLPGIVLIRIHPPLLNDILQAFKQLFDNYKLDSFNGKLIVLSKSGYRVR